MGKKSIYGMKEKDWCILFTFFCGKKVIPKENRDWRQKPVGNDNSPFPTSALIKLLYYCGEGHWDLDVVDWLRLPNFLSFVILCLQRSFLSIRKMTFKGLGSVGATYLYLRTV
jgi:hypothetical protein